MPTPEQHALLSASSAHRWLHCTAAPRFEAQFPESTSEYAEEGRLAHAFCENKVLARFNRKHVAVVNAQLCELRKDPLYTEEMDRTSDFYVKHLSELAAMICDDIPSVNAEVRVDFSDYVPEGFGTCDCVMIGNDTLCITDYKHGKGVPISAEGNPQMRLYALGALKKYLPIYGDKIKRVIMTIDQPRIQGEVSRETITVADLLAWGEEIKPIAKQAFDGDGVFCPGEHCRFCRGKAQCRARAEQNTAIAAYADCVPPNKTPATGQDVLTDAEIGDLLVRGAHLVAWYHDIEEYALSALLGGKEVPGWKVVAGRSVRSFTDQDAAIAAVIAAGYDEALVFERKPKTLTQIEQLMGKAEFAEKLGQFVSKPTGKPTLAPQSDKREAYSPAATDFAEIVNQ